MTSRKTRHIAGLCLAVGIVIAIWAASASDGSAGTTASAHGDQTTEAAVIRALEKTGYQIRYRKVPDIEGYGMVAGRASNSWGGAVEFSVVIQRGGPYKGDPESAKEGPQQWPVLRYAEEGGTKTGNEILGLQAQSPYRVANVRRLGPVWVQTRGESQIDVRISQAIEKLFAAKFRGAA
jgi:hypothetical protein